MSSWSKLGLLLSGFCLIVMVGSRSILGIWHPILYGFLSLFVIGLLISLILDYKFYLDFLSMRTTKNGLSLGWSLILLLILLVAFGYLGNRFNKSFDLTEEGINSLAIQTQQTLDNLEKELKIYVFYKGDKISKQAVLLKQSLKEKLFLYKQGSSKIKVLYVDTYKNNQLSENFLNNLLDKNDKEIFVFVEYSNRKVRADEPFAEQNLTSAIIKVKKRETKEIYFMVGHGERNLTSEKPDGLKIFEQYLNDSGFILKEWSFIQDGTPKSNPPLVLVIGPNRPFLAAELNWFKKYLSEDGRLVLAIDPKEKHNLQGFLKNYGVIFKNDFIVSQIGLIYGGITKALGVTFDRLNNITKRFFGSGRDAVFFEKASSLEVAPEAFNKFKYSYLVRSHDKSFTVPQLSNRISVKEFKSLVMALEVSPKREGDKDHKDHEGHEGHEDHEDHKEKGFRLAVFGDSDFVSNRYFYEGINRDLALNTMVSFLGEEDLVTIRPKQPKGTKVQLTRVHRMGVVLLMIVLPLVFLITSLLLWYRRREA